MPHVILLYCVFYAQRHKNSFPIKPTMCVGISLDKLLKAFFIWWQKFITRRHLIMINWLSLGLKDLIFA